MGDAAREPADRLDLLRLPELLGKLPALGDVLVEGVNADELSALDQRDAVEVDLDDPSVLAPAPGLGVDRPAAQDLLGEGPGLPSQVVRGDEVVRIAPQ